MWRFQKKYLDSAADHALSRNIMSFPVYTDYSKNSRMMNLEYEKGQYITYKQSAGELGLKVDCVSSCASLLRFVMFWKKSTWIVLRIYLRSNNYYWGFCIIYHKNYFTYFFKKVNMKIVKYHKCRYIIAKIGFKLLE